MKTAIIGMGALGLLYADQITSGTGDMDSVEFVMDSDRVARHAGDIYTINGEKKCFKVTDAAKAKPSDLVIVAVKYNSLLQALDTMRDCIGPDTIIISVMNGVTSEKIIAERYGWQHMLYAVAQGMDAMRDGSALKYTKCGNVHIGATDSKMEENLHIVRSFFETAKVPHIVEDDIMYRMWFKFMLNVGINQTCMVFDTTYGVATVSGEESNEKMVGAMREVITQAALNGVTLTEADIDKCIEIEKTLDPDGYPSMAQDRKAKRKSEVDMFAGEVIRMAKSNGMSAPYNEFFMERVRAIEAEYDTRVKR